MRLAIDTSAADREVLRLDHELVVAHHGCANTVEHMFRDGSRPTTVATHQMVMVGVFGEVKDSGTSSEPDGADDVEAFEFVEETIDRRFGDVGQGRLNALSEVFDGRMDIVMIEESAQDAATTSGRPPAIRPDLRQDRLDPSGVVHQTDSGPSPSGC